MCSPLSHPWMDSARQTLSEGKQGPGKLLPHRPPLPCLQRDVFVYEQRQALFLWKCALCKTRYKKAICVLLKDLSRGAQKTGF